MAKMVGLSRNIKLQWLNEVARLEQENLTLEEMKGRLNEYLGFEISSPTNLRKTREILLNIWHYENDYTVKMKQEALALVNEDPENRMPVHWCMMLMAYPVFVDLCKMIGKMFQFSDEIILSQVKQKVFDEWGERTTLFHSIDKIIATMKEFGVITCIKPGRYHVNKYVVTKGETIDFITMTAMMIDGSGYYSFQELNDMVYMFPFEYNVSKEMLLQDERYMMTGFGGEVSFSLKE